MDIEKIINFDGKLAPDIPGIIVREWQMFQKVNNEGGRAYCQDDLITFYIMRAAQFRNWPEALRDSYFADLGAASKEGKNLLAFKYGYMMEYTSPEAFENIKAQLPAVTTERQEKADRITAAQVAQFLELSEIYPNVTGRARKARSEQDRAFGGTSFETYLRGELKTYSGDTLELYSRFMESPGAENLIYNIYNDTVRMYGYSSMEDAEKKLNR
ncbi:MAG: DUF4125 family protein [Lachnospiraceae bacterium]|nr:DUF4125 family protein [Lachnospiraceae bacterium]